MAKNVHKIGAYSRTSALVKLDGRTKEAQYLEGMRADLTAHLGGNPSTTERHLIDRAAWLSLRVALLDIKLGETNVMTEHDSNTYLAWTNSLTRTLTALGLKSAPQRALSLDDQIAAKAAAKQTATAAPSAAPPWAKRGAAA